MRGAMQCKERLYSTRCPRGESPVTCGMWRNGGRGGDGCGSGRDGSPGGSCCPSSPRPARAARAARARRRTFVNPQFAAFRYIAGKPPLAEKITRRFRGGKPCRKRRRKRRPLFAPTGGFFLSKGLWKTMFIHHQWFFESKKTQHIVPKWRIVGTSKNAVVRDQGCGISRNFRTRRPGGLSLLRARFWKL